jgi:phosphoglycolate phosphatase-like HAD superfamily hydrolase
MSEDDLAREVRRLADRISHWTPPRWAASGVSGPGSRADLVHALAQELADRAADAEGQPRRPVPRPEHDATLVDQVRVLAADLTAAGGDVSAAARLVADTGKAL